MATMIELAGHAELPLPRTVETSRLAPTPAAMPKAMKWARVASPTCALVIAAWIGLRAMGSAQPRLDVSHSNALMLAVAITTMHHWLRSVMGVTLWIAIPLSTLYIAHPLLRPIAFGDGSVIGLTALIVIPLLGIAAKWMVCHSRLLPLATLAAVAGALAALQPMVVLTIFGGLVIMAAMHRPPSATRKNAILLSTKNVVLALIVAFSAMNIGRWALTRFGSEPANASSHLAVSLMTPLALIDRAGWVSARLAPIAAIHPEAGGAWYLGWGLLALALIGCVSAKKTSAARPIGLIVALMLLLIWCGLGSDSLHAQLRQLFEYATVRRRVEPTTLNLLGLMFIPLTMLVALGYAAMTSLFDSRRRRGSFIGVFTGVGVMLAWWTTCPAMLPDGPRVQASVLASSLLTLVVIAFALSTSAALGLAYMLKRFSRRHEAALVWLVTLACLSLDLTYAAARPPSTNLNSNSATSAPSAN